MSFANLIAFFRFEPFFWKIKAGSMTGDPD
jgi:hypothetical protein